MRSLKIKTPGRIEPGVTAPDWDAGRGSAGADVSGVLGGRASPEQHVGDGSEGVEGE
jgi:hypothetical protein